MIDDVIKNKPRTIQLAQTYKLHQNRFCKTLSISLFTKIVILKTTTQIVSKHSIRIKIKSYKTKTSSNSKNGNINRWKKLTLKMSPL